MTGTGYLILVVIAVLLGGVAWYFFTRRNPVTTVEAFGPAPAIPPAQPQAVPTLKMPTAVGWKAGEKPVAAPGLAVTAFASGLKHPRWIYVLPNGDVLVAESAGRQGRVTSIRGAVMRYTMRRAGATVASANRITLLRDADGDGIPEIRETFMEGLHQPFGMALIGNTFYVGNTDAVVAFPYVEGALKITAPGKKLLDLKPHNHWTRNLFPSADRTRLFIGVGSASNIGDNGMEAEVNRACIIELDLATNRSRIFASGLRNAVGMEREPTTGALWTVVNERDAIGDETPPDYLTSVRDGGFYGWPYSYWGQTVDERVQPQNPALVATAIVPDYALGGHTASLGLCWVPDGMLPGVPAGMAIGQHGSWNRSTLSGYKVVLVPFVNGRPAEARPRDLLTGFLAPDEKTSYGRPVGVTVAKDGSLLVADDVGNTVWRITGAQPKR
jgi:glucose/arabinose dehydrogenase